MPQVASSGRKTWLVPDLGQPGSGSRESLNSDKPPHWFEVTKVPNNISKYFVLFTN